MAKISACLVVHNEEKLIKRCLDSIEKVVDEIIIVHDGPCNDKTLEIAKKYTNKIFVRPLIGEAEPHRVFAYKKAKGGWILKIDADEFLPERTQKVIRNLVNREDVNGYALLWCLWDGKKYITKNWPHKLCLFRKNKISYLGFPHAAEEVDGKVLKINYKLGHKPLYNNYSFRVFKSKWLKWAKIQAEYTLKDFSDIEKFNYKKKDFKLSTRLKRKFPEILLIPLAISTFFKIFLLDKYYRAKHIGLKISIMHALYQAAICYYSHKLKLKQKNKK